MQSNVFGNPHSQNPSSTLTTRRVEAVRDRILKYFNADPAEYQVIFTKGATGALKTVGETYPWSDRSVFRYAAPASPDSTVSVPEHDHLVYSMLCQVLHSLRRLQVRSEHLLHGSHCDKVRLHSKLGVSLLKIVLPASLLRTCVQVYTGEPQLCARHQRVCAATQRPLPGVVLALAARTVCSTP